MAASRALRSPLAVTFGVWRALFLREAASRLARDRLAWLWLLLEPLAHIVLLIWIFAAGFRSRVIAGANVGEFIMLGILGFFLVRNIMNRSIDAVSSSDALYAYRQVQPVDAVIVRVAVEGLLIAVLFLIMLGGAALIGHPIFPADPLGAMEALGALWLTGLGLGLVFSVLSNLVTEVGRMIRLLLTPLYFFSGVMYPSIIVPPTLRDYLLLNPIVHGLESLRVAFMPMYLVPPGIELGYLYEFSLVLIFLGLALHIHFRNVLVDDE